MFTLLMELGRRASTVIKAGVTTYEQRNGDVSPEELAKATLRDLADWKPTHRGVPILTPALRLQLAKGFAGLAYNIGASQAGRRTI